MTLQPAAGPPGSHVVLQGTGFHPGETVSISAGERRVGARRAGRHGGFTAQVTLRRFSGDKVEIRSRGADARVLNVFRRAGASPGMAEVGSERGARLRWSPDVGSPGTLVRLAGFGLPGRRPARLAFPGMPTSAFATSGSGSFRQSFQLPFLVPGEHVGAVTVGRVRLRFRQLVLAPLLFPPFEPPGDAAPPAPPAEPPGGGYSPPVRDPGRMTVVKRTAPSESASGGGEFDFQLPAELGGGFSLRDEGSRSVEVDPGEYTVRESAHDGYRLASVACSDADSTGSTATATATFRISSGEDVTCTFTNEKWGRVVVRKLIEPAASAAAGAEFEFRPDAALGGQGFTLRHGEERSFAVAAGSYAVEELTAPGYELAGVGCDDADSSGSVAERRASVRVAPGEVVVCTFRNASWGRLRVDKVTAPGGDGQRFGFGAPGLPGTGDDAFELADASAPREVAVPAGDYAVSEDPDPTGWALRGVSCSDRDDPAGASTVSGRTATASVQPGETVTCTFTNHRWGRVVVEKQTEPDRSPELFGFESGDVPELDGVQLGDGDRSVAVSVPPGRHAVSERAVPGWAVRAIACSDAAQPDGEDSDAEPGAGRVTFDVQSAETVTCTFTNAKPGRITVEKQTVPAESPTAGTSFRFAAGPGLAAQGFDLRHDGGRSFSVPAGSYTVAELATAGYELSAISCDDADSSGSTAGGQASFEVAGGERVTCTFTSTRGSAAPAANADRVAAAQDGGLVLDPAANDSATTPGQELRIVELGPASYGTAKLLPGDRVDYRPPPGYAGPDWFDYRVCHDPSREQCDTATVSVAVGPVTATAETAPVRNGGDSGDDPAIWVHPTDPAESTIIGTDKDGDGRSTSDPSGGLAVYDLAGNELHYIGGSDMTSVDLRGGFPLAGQSVSLVTAANRRDNTIAVFKVDPTTRRLVNVAARSIAAGVSVLGSCMYRSSSSGRFYVFLGSRTDAVEQWELYDDGSGKVDARLVRSFSVDGSGRSPIEGCVADDELGQLYVSERDYAIWKYSAEPDHGTARTLVDATDSSAPGGRLGHDVEGLAIADQGAGEGYLIASSATDGRFVAYRREGQNEYVRSFAVRGSGSVDGVTRSEGLDVTTAELGTAFPDGLLVAHDGSNDGGNQNLKLVSLDAALGSGGTTMFPSRPASCERPYSAASPWNGRIDANAAYHVRSEFHVGALQGTLSADPTQYTYPVYEVSSATPLRDVTLSGWYSNVTDGGSILRNLREPDGSTVAQLPIPDGAAAAAGADAQIILVDRATGDEWGASSFRRDGGGAWTGWNAYHYNTRWSGVPPRDGADRPFFPRGAGIPYLAGLVRPCELARGRIEHAIAFAYDSPTAAYVYPATKSDGIGTDPADMPEGSRLQLDPALTREQIEAWGCTGPCLTIARALQDYGMYIVDNSGRPKIYLEYEGTADWNGAVSERTSQPIPLSGFKLLETPP